MPGWGTDSFENDSAQDFLKALNSKQPVDLKQILERAVEVEYPGELQSSVVIVVAEVVAAAKGSPSRTIPPQVGEWIAKIEGAPSAEMLELAQRAVSKVRMNSELKDLWLEADGLNDWSAALRDLEERLSR